MITIKEMIIEEIITPEEVVMIDEKVVTEMIMEKEDINFLSI
jgi:hypothetical protein